MIPGKYIKFRNLVLLFTSLIFYGWGEPRYIYVMIVTIIIDYIGGFLIDKYHGDRKKAKTVLVVTIIINLAILGFFKYYNFIAANLRLIPGMEFIPNMDIVLPIGISFYTFQALSYVIDIYRKTASVQKNIVSFGTYITLFPQLIAGPIIRYFDVDKMFRERSETVMLFASGIRTFIAGLAKKVLLANTAWQLWESFKALPDEYRTVVGSWMGMFFFGFHIYFDFSGYSDMAIGLGKMFGFKFLENFNYPYISKSITEFWRRWHISLSTWFREYVYFPLGGSRRSSFITFRNLLIVWLLTGFWHGASWNFILWGLYYFILLVIEKAFLLKLLNKIPAVFRHIYTLLFVLFGWLLFTAENLEIGMQYLQNMFGFALKTQETSGFISSLDIYDIIRNLVFVAIMVIAATPYPKRLFYRYYQKSQTLKLAAYIAGIAIFILCTAYLVDTSFNPFLYFRF